MLDDCFGQAYFNMKETQGNELLALIKYVKLSENKLLLLNSRVTIYGEAKVRTSGLTKGLKNKGFKVQIIDMSDMPFDEKAKILYNHLYFNEIPPDHFLSLKIQKRYRKIVTHPNYNPRIVEFVCNPHQYKDVEATSYFDFVKGHLENPEKVWEDEYVYRLRPADRILLTTLYSLTDTTCSIEFLEECFNFRINNTSDIDLTLDQFSSSLWRLQEAFIKIVDENDQRMVAMVNPSINDYLRSRMKNSAIEREALIKDSASIRQLSRMLPKDEYRECLASIFESGAVLEYLFETEREKTSFITYYVAFNQILHNRYKVHVQNYLRDMTYVRIFEDRTIRPIDILLKITEDAPLRFYALDDLLNDFYLLENILADLEISDLVEMIVRLFKLYGNQEEFLLLCNATLHEALDNYCQDCDAGEFDIDLAEHIKDHISIFPDPNGHGYTEINEEYVIESVEQEVQQIVEDELNGYLAMLPAELSALVDTLELPDVYVSGAEKLVQMYLKSDSYDDDYIQYMRYDKWSVMDFDEIDMIFDR